MDAVNSANLNIVAAQVNARESTRQEGNTSAEVKNLQKSRENVNDTKHLGADRSQGRPHNSPFSNDTRGQKLDIVI